jgi:hypothetical protein
MSHSLGFLISDLSRRLRRRFDERARQLGATRAQWRTLTMLCRNGLSQGALAELLEVEPIALCRIVNRLEGAAPVERRRDPTDRRAWQLVLTESRPILDKLRVMAGNLFDQKLDAHPGFKVRGCVQGISAAIGYEFSVLSAQNANGAWVKVTQCVPVRIAITGKTERAPIAGLSNNIVVDTKPNG